MVFLWSVCFVLFMISAGMIGYSMGYNDGREEERMEQYEATLDVISQFIDVN